MAWIKAWNKELDSGRQAQICPSLCGSGGVSGLSTTHVETLCSLAPPEDPGQAAADQESRQGRAALLFAETND